MQQANDFEYILLVYLSFITAIEISSAINIDHTFINVIVSLLIIAPIPMLFYYVYRLYQQLSLQRNDPKKYDDIQQDALDIDDVYVSKKDVKSVDGEVMEVFHQKSNTVDVADMITNMVKVHELGVSIPADVDGDEDISSSMDDIEDQKDGSTLRDDAQGKQIEMI